MKGSKVGEEAIMQAVYGFREGFYHFTWAAAEDYGIKPHTIQQHLQGNGPLHGHPNLNRTLNEAQEQALLNYVTSQGHKPLFYDHLDRQATMKVSWHDVYATWEPLPRWADSYGHLTGGFWLYFFLCNLTIFLARKAAPNNSSSLRWGYLLITITFTSSRSYRCHGYSIISIKT